MIRPQLLILNPTAHAQIYQGLSSEYAAIEPPIWAAMIANSLRNAGYKIELIDSVGEQLGYLDVAELVREMKPHLVAVVVYGQQPSASTQNMHGARLTIEAIRGVAPDVKISILGGHPSALPLRTMEEEDVDFVCQGEGILSLRGLLDVKMDQIDQIKQVPGLWYRDGNGVKSTAPATIIEQPDLVQQLPGPAYDLLPMHRYRAHDWHCYGRLDDRLAYASIYTSLGCPFNCSFCCINAPFGTRQFRFWDPKFIISIIDELATLYGVRHLKIADEMFVLKESHFIELCRLIAERDYDLNIWAYARIDTINERNLYWLKRAGINWLGLGIESVSTAIRRDVIKGKFSEDRIYKVVGMIQDAGIHVAGNFIFGLPQDDPTSMRYNLEQAMGLRLDMANFYTAMAYPGSRLYETAQGQNTQLPDSWLVYSQHAFECLPLPTDHLTAGQVLAFRDHSWQAFHSDPNYLNHMKNKFGEADANHIIKMSQYRLPRKYAEKKLNVPLRFDHFNSDDYIIPAE